MRSYETWEAVCTIVALGLLVLYAVTIRSSRIGAFQKFVRPVYVAIHDRRKSTNNITAIQNLRNIITLSMLLSSTSLAFAVMCARLGANSVVWAEMMMVTALWAVSFVNYGLAANATHYLIINIGLYSEDKLEGIPRAVAEYSWARSKRQLSIVGRHVDMGARSLFMAVPCTFVAIHPVAFLSATVVSLWTCYYVDRKFGVVLGSVKVEGLA